jgi:hypothetical protein
LPGRFYTALGYAPLAGRAQLIAYWIRHGRPMTIRAVPGLPTRDVRIAFRGTDSLRVKDRLRLLNRYSARALSGAARRSGLMNGTTSPES